MMGAVFRSGGKCLSFGPTPCEVFVNSQQSSLFNFICRRLKSVAALTALTASLLVAGAFGQNNPVPQIVGPVHPDAVAPGSGSFTLSVYGANFVSGAVVNWNYQPRTTTFISAHEVQAQILATDVEKNTAGFITVTNPAPGGGPSSASWAQVEVHAPVSTVSMNAPTTYAFGFWAMAAADFKHNGSLDLAGEYDSDLLVYDGNGSGNFSYGSIAYQHYLTPTTIGYGDFNNDGNLDLAVVSDLDGISMAFVLGNGKGGFNLGSLITHQGATFYNPTIGDFNQDGNLDLVTRGETSLTTYLGNGNGTFRSVWSNGAPAHGMAEQLLAGDFNGDGKLDLILVQTPQIVVNGQTTWGKAFWFAKGNGDGSFGSLTSIASFPGVTTSVCAGGIFSNTGLQLSDFNGDGKLDLAFCNQSQIGVMLGNGDGTFRPATYYTADPTGLGLFTFAIGDINSDGKPDLIVSEYSNFTSNFVVFLGNGDGTFQAPQTIYSNALSGEIGINLGDFNNDGLLDVVFRNSGGAYVYLQTEAGGPDFDLTGVIRKVGAPSFAPFAKDGKHECIGNGFCAGLQKFRRQHRYPPLQKTQGRGTLS
jgi:hypothetical protein